MTPMTNSVEPTTSATDELRCLLDERGVEYTVVHGYREYIWEFGESGIARASAIGTRGLVQMIVANVTPEQAVAATIGDVPRLPYFWTADGTLHIELPRLPESISVRLPDQRDREVGSARTWQYTLGSGTCRHEGDPTDFCCSECGARMFTDTGETYTMIDSLGNIIEQPNFCPNCGRKVVDE